MKRELIVILLLFLLSFPAVRYLLLPGGYTSHDLTHHVVRQISMDKLLSEGQFPPRWSGELNNGYGYPVFLFNYPLPAMLGQVFHLLGFNYLYSVKAVLFSSLVLSVLGMYLFLRSYFGSKLASFLGAMFYLYAPHRFLNVYVAAALGSAFGGAILPFVFWGLVKIKQTQKISWVLITSLFYACLILSHNITTLIFTPLILAFMGLLIWESEHKLALFKRFILMFVLGLCLSCWFWLPALSEKSYIKFDAVFGKFYENQFPTLKQLIGSKWGFGLSHPDNPQEGDLSYQIGLINIMATGFLLFATLVFRRIRGIGIFVLFFFFISLFLILKSSKPLWDFVPLLNTVQFPWRFSAIIVFVSSIGAALLIKYLPYKRLIFISFLILVIYANRNHWRINEVYNPGEDYYKSINSTTASFDEHLPKWGKAMPKPVSAKLEFASGVGQIKVLENKSARLLAQVESTSSSKLRFNQIYFPNWEIEVDNQKTDFNYLEDGPNYGLPVFVLSPGSHLIKAEFKNTPVRNIADGISLASVILWVILLCRLLIKK